MQKTWFITGAARGLGAHIAQAALRAGDRVVATGRSPEKLVAAWARTTNNACRWRSM